MNQAKAATVGEVKVRGQRGSLSPWHDSARKEETKAKVEKMITNEAGGTE